MPFNGAGVFNRLYSWVTDKANGIKILASRVDGEMDGMAAGLTNTITRDGQSTTLARIPFAQGIATQLGSSSAPSIAAIGDPNTGLDFPADDTIALVAGGVEVVTAKLVAGLGVTTISGSLNISGSLTTGSSSIWSTTNLPNPAKTDAANIFTQNQQIYKANPGVVYNWGGFNWTTFLNSDNRFYIYGSNGANFSVGTGGDISCSQLGDINNRIETRAQAWAIDRANDAYSRAYNDATGHVDEYFVTGLRVVDAGDAYFNSSGGNAYGPGNSFIWGLDAWYGYPSGAIGGHAIYRYIQFYVPHHGWLTM